MSRGFAAEYASLESLLGAIRAVRAKGFDRLEAYTPYPAHEVDAALGARRSPLAIAAGIGAFVGAVSAYWLQWYLVAYLYPVDAGNRPPHMPLAFTIITIEMGFLFGALTVVTAFMIAARLVKLWDPVFEIPGFESATRAGFWLTVTTDDRTGAEDVLKGTQPSRLHAFGGAT